MPGGVFADQVEQFTAVVHALLQGKETRAAFVKAPLATLKDQGIEFKDAAVARKVEVELTGWLGRLGDDDICPPIQFVWTHAPLTQTRTMTSTMAMTRTVAAARATSITWVVKPGNIEDVIRIDQPRVDAFVTRVGLENQIALQQARITELEALIAKR